MTVGGAVARAAIYPQPLDITPATKPPTIPMQRNLDDPRNVRSSIGPSWRVPSGPAKALCKPAFGPARSYTAVRFPQVARLTVVLGCCTTMPRRGELAAICLVAVGACGGHDSNQPTSPVDVLPAVGNAAGRAPLCPAFDLASPANVCSRTAPSSFGVKVIEKTYVCGELLQGTGRFLELWRDP